MPFAFHKTKYVLLKILKPNRLLSKKMNDEMISRSLEK